jgi:hypothetical protein
MNWPVFSSDDWRFSLEIVLGGTYRGVSDAGEILSTASRITDGDADSWVAEWCETAGRIWAAAQDAEEGGHRESALSHYRRAGAYYDTALAMIAFSSERDRELALWRRQRECWDRVVDLLPVPGERLQIPYEGTALPGYFFRAPDAAPGQPRPIVVINNGSDGATADMWRYGGAAAAERGYHWMTFDGPGQQAALFELGIPFRPDWEAVLTPVLDALIPREDVDSERIAVIGISQGGYWVPRALAFEHRFAAAVVDPGAVDVSAAWLRALPDTMRDQLERGERETFDREMHLAEMFSPELQGRLDWRGTPYGVTSGSRYDLFRTAMSYRLGDEVREITTSLLITDPDEEQFWPGQSQELLGLLPGRAELARFTVEEGAGRHCEPMGSAVRDARIFDWLAAYLRQPAAVRDPGGR